MKTNIFKIITLLIFILLASISFGQVVINEYSASNLTGYVDNYNKTEDWIELYNSSSSSVDIGGYYLSDKDTYPMKWEIPVGTSIPAHGFKVFWASGRDEVSGNHYHTNFKLKQTKETPEHVILSDTSGTVINQFALEITQVEHSMGRETDGGTTWKIFTSPTKGSTNSSSSYSNYAATPTMSEEAGFYTGSVSVSITNNESNSTVRYTTNGNLPTSSSSVYSSPINITSTTVLKAICIPNDSNILPSFVSFNTYFIDTDHSLPILSTAGNNMQNMLNGNQSLKPHGTIEYFEDGIRKDFGYGEYNKHGQDSWQFDQRSYDYIARDEMGYHAAIEQKLLELSERESYQRIIIRASGDDNYPGIDSSAHIRDVFIQKLANKNNLKVDMRRGERCVSYVNGDFWGVYSIREKVTDADYTKFYYDQDKYNIQYLMLWGGTWAEYGGSQAMSDWAALRNFILSHDMTNEADFNYVDSQYDYKSLIDYIIINSFVVCTDWINWNVGWWRGLDPEGGHQKWGYILWDEDATFNHYINYTGVPDETPDADPCYPEGITADPGQHIEILNQLLENETVSQYYVSRYQDLMNTVFVAEDMIELLESIENAIAPEMPKQFDRWGGNMDEWHGNVQKIKDFITDREAVIPEGLNSCYDLTGPYDVSLNVVPIGSGAIQFNSLVLGNTQLPWAGVYHGGMNMQLKALENNSNFAFDHWELNNHTLVPNENTAEVTLELTQEDEIKAIFVSTNSQDIVINEINYNSSDDFNTGDWIELYNNGSESVDISNWVFKDEDDTHQFTIPNGTTMDVETYLVLTQHLADFEALVSVDFPIIGSFDFGLSGGGELIRLFDETGAIIDQVTYDDDAPWPVEADGNGPTLELTNPNYDNELAESWHASNPNDAPQGTPGYLNSNDVIGADDFKITKNKISIFPNPLTNTSILKIISDTSIQNGKLTINSILGEKIIEVEFNSNEITIQKKQLNTGIYICKVYENDVFLGSTKIIVE